MSFDLQEVFSSVESFISSGYVLTAVLIILGIGALKKIFGLLVIGAIAFVLWFLFQDQVSAVIEQALSFLPELKEYVPQLVDAVFDFFGM